MNKNGMPALQALDDVRARVLAMATQICGDSSCPIQQVLSQCVDDAIAVHWQGRVKTFVPLLAVRDVQECIHQGYCPHLGSVPAP